MKHAALELELSKLRVGDLPADDDPGVQTIADSFKAVGQLVPVLIDEELRLIAGRHRYVAARLLGWKKICVFSTHLRGALAELAALDENLARAKRTALVESRMIATRKALYEEAFPQTKQGGAPGKKGGGKSKNDTVSSFAKDTAEKTGRSQRQVQRYAKAAEIDPIAQGYLKGTKAEDSITDLVEISKLPLLEQRDVALMLARKPDATAKQAIKARRRAEQLEQVKTYVPPIGKHQVVSVDFSWKYDDALDGPGMDRGLPYPSMSVAEIKAFINGTLADCCDEVCLLACWVTNPIMLDLDTWSNVQAYIEALGFRPRKLMTWEKTNDDGSPFVGLGTGPRNNSEQLVLFTRGAVMFNETGAAHGRPLQFTVFSAPVGANSEKPQRAYDLLEAMVPYASRLELFARRPRPGWVTSGSELAATASDAVQRTAPERPQYGDGTDCGARPSRNGDPCIHKLGHDGVHSNGRLTWRDKKPKERKTA